MRVFELLLIEDVVEFLDLSNDQNLKRGDLLTTKLPLLVGIWLTPKSMVVDRIGEVRYDLINEVFTSSLIQWREVAMGLNVRDVEEKDYLNSLVKRIAEKNEKQWAATAKIAIEYGRQQDFLEMFYNYYILARPKGAIEEFGETLIQEISDFYSK